MVNRLFILTHTHISHTHTHTSHKHLTYTHTYTSHTHLTYTHTRSPILQIHSSEGPRLSQICRTLLSDKLLMAHWREEREDASLSSGQPGGGHLASTSLTYLKRFGGVVDLI